MLQVRQVRDRPRYERLLRHYTQFCLWMSSLQALRECCFAGSPEPKMTAVNRKRIVITGMGAISPNGIGIEAFGAALAAGESGVSELEGINTSGLKSWAAAAARDFDPASVLDV